MMVKKQHVGVRLPPDLLAGIESVLPAHDGKISAVIIAALRAYLPSVDADNDNGPSRIESIETRLAAIEKIVFSGAASAGPSAVPVRSTSKRDSQTVSIQRQLADARTVATYDEKRTREIIMALKGTGKRFLYADAAAALNAAGLTSQLGLPWDAGRVKTFIQRKM